MADGAIHVTVVTPERSLVDDRVDELQIPGLDGYLGVLPGHAPLFTELKVGALGYKKSGSWYWVAVAWGFAEVLPDEVHVLAETAERAHEIDVERAKRAKERAEQLISRGGDDLDFAKETVSVERAVVRIQVSERAHHHPQ